MAEPEPFEFAGREIKRGVDPTRTKTKRSRWLADSNRRFNELMRVIKITLVDNDALGLRAINQQVTPAPPKAFSRMSDPDKLKSFMKWLEVQESRGVLEIVLRAGALDPEPWTNTYIRSSYAGGLLRGNSDLRQLDLPLGTIEPMTAADAALAMSNPVNANRAGLIYSQTWEGMTGVTAQMNSQISQILARGLAAGTSPIQLAREINDRVDKIGKTRSALIARTETVLAHNTGALAEYKSAEQDIGEEVLVQWWATLDNRVRPWHAARHGKVFKNEDAQRLLGEPNCRCTVLPIVESVSGKQDISKSSQFLTKTGKPKTSA